MSKIAVLIPCYNEAQTIGKVVADFQQILPESSIYVYDNNSTDGTARIASSAGATVIPEYVQGKGAVVRSMFRSIEADCYIMVDGDDTYDADISRELVNAVLSGKADMVIGDRLSGAYFTENKRPFHNTGNKLVRNLINLIFNSDIKDIMTGYRAFSRRFVKTFPVLSSGFEIETEMTIHALDKRLRTIELPVIYRDRPEGSVSKLNTFRDGIKVLRIILSLFKDYKPFSFFGIISLVLFGTGTFLFVPVFIEYLQIGLVPKLPTLIMAIAFWIISLLSFTCGILLSTIKRYVNQMFELEITRAERNVL